MAGVVKSMDSAMRSMNLEKVRHWLNQIKITDYFWWDVYRGGDCFLFSWNLGKNNEDYQHFEICEMFISWTRTTQI